MPIQKCEVDGRPGFKWGEQGKCYTYTPGDEESMARAKAACERQGRAIEASKHAED